MSIKNNSFSSPLDGMNKVRVSVIFPLRQSLLSDEKEFPRTVALASYINQDINQSSLM